MPSSAICVLMDGICTRMTIRNYEWQAARMMCISALMHASPAPSSATCVLMDGICAGPGRHKVGDGKSGT